MAEDWRGTPINIGDTVIYGAPVGRSIAMVEGIVDSFTKTGRVNVKVVRRAYGLSGKDVVHVGPDRLTIVTKLPDTSKPDVKQEKIESLRRSVVHWQSILQNKKFDAYWTEEKVKHYLDESQSALWELENKV